MTFNTIIKSELEKLPDELGATVETSIKRWGERLTELDIDFNPPQVVATSMVKVWCSSQFIAENCLKRPELLLDLINSGDLLASYPELAFTQKLSLIQVEDESSLMSALRHKRYREMVRIAWRDIAGWATLTETLADLSHLADACIQYALAFLYQNACEKRGTPLLSNGKPQQIVVLGMGKLGAYELNYSSDIDLIFAYEEDGVLPDRKSTSYGEFFTRLCQSLVKVLDEITVDGFVFRTDIRLRPYGDSGAIIMTFDGMENYYLTQAREWERYAMIKARQVAGDFEVGAQLMAMLNSFVYRRYLDYGAFEELRSLKMQITQELKRKDRLENIKLGPGGIREIEFIGQAFQLIRGGTEKSLKTRGILDVLKILGNLSLITKNDADQLIESYCFLRRVENHIQEYQDKQTHDLPTSPVVQQILAYSLDYPDWDSFKKDLDVVRTKVHAVFDQVFSLSKQETIDQNSKGIWLAASDDIQLKQSLIRYGFQEPEEILSVIKEFKNSAAIRRLTAKGAGVIDRLMPQVMEAMPQVNNPDETLRRILELFTAVAGRTVYLSLLSENPGALAQVIRLASASPWISAYISQYPILLDEFLDHRSLFEPLKKADLDTQLNSILAPVEIQDIETLMIKLREFKQLNVLRVAAADIMGLIPIMVVSDYLTYIAEAIVDQVVQRTWLMLTEKHGCPPGCRGNAVGSSSEKPSPEGRLAWMQEVEQRRSSCREGWVRGNKNEEKSSILSSHPNLHSKGEGAISLKTTELVCTDTATGFAVIGFGKLGGIELGYGSDLDLVFLYDCQDGNAMTDGQKPILCSQFYGRLGLKVRHILDTKMLSGVLYEVDMRLRPSGDSGLLVAHINSYEDYYKNQAWTWEHQALVRGRFIAGDINLKRQFEAIRQRILCLPRDTLQLKTEVRDMREKMRAALAAQETEKFDLKQSKGGIADIEFIVQFGVLDQASTYEALTSYTDNVRLLEGLQVHGFISKDAAETLKAAYCAYRDTGHKLVLQGDRILIEDAEVAEMRARVEQIWHDIMDDA